MSNTRQDLVWNKQRIPDKAGKQGWLIPRGVAPRPSAPGDGDGDVGQRCGTPDLFGTPSSRTVYI